jgi:hypothetical protein
MGGGGEPRPRVNFPHLVIGDFFNSIGQWIEDA